MAKTVRLKFKSDEGRKFTISLGSVNPALEEEGGKDLAQATVDTLMLEQPLNKVIAKCLGVEIVERNVTAIL